MNICRDACMTQKQAADFGSKTGWWVLDRVASKFLGIGWRRTATEPIELDLPPGRYRLGAGPPDHYREDIEIGPDGREIVNAAAPPVAGPQSIPCLAVGCDGQLEVASVAELEACDAWTLTPPTSRLCPGCQP